MRSWLLLLLVSHTVAAAPALDDEVQDLRRRVQELEQQTRILHETHKAFVESITKTIDESALVQESALDLEKHVHSKLQASGYADVEFRNSSIENSHPSFRIHHFSLILTKELDPSWRTFAEVEYEDAPQLEFEPGSPDCQGSCSGEILLEAMNIDYSPRDSLGFRLGRFFTPAGIWAIDHYPPFVPTQERPLHIDNIFPRLIDGILFHGSLPVIDAFFNYDFYLGNGEGNSGARDENDDKALGLRTAIQLPWLSQLEFGASVYGDQLNPGDRGTANKLAAGIHARLRGGPVAFQTEVASAQYWPEGDRADFQTTGYYAQLSVDFFNALIGYRYDFFEDYDLDALAAIEVVRHTIFNNVRVHENVVLKLEHHFTTRAESDAVNLSVASLVVHLGD